MRLSQLFRQSAAAGALCAASLALAGPALAHDGHQDGRDHYKSGHGPYPGGYPAPGYPPQGYPAHGYPGPGMDPEAREAWLEDCRRELGRGKSAAGGALIGGVVGGVAGNRIAGRGNRTEGTIAGAAIGAGAGALIDHAGDKARTRDECEAYLADYEARYRQPGYGHGGYGYQYPAYGYGGGCCQPMMMVPVTMVPRGEPECTETVEYVYEDVPVRPARRKIVPDKRVKTRYVK
jgi:hypothetical protein